MPVKTNIQSIFTGKSLFLYILLFPLLSFNNITYKSDKNSDTEIALTKSNSGYILEIDSNNVNTLIPEQDPEGIYWGLRDTLTGKLVLDYSFQKILDFKDGYALVILNSKFGLIDKRGKVIIKPDCTYPKSKMECGFIAFEVGDGPVLIFDSTGKSVMPMIYGFTGILSCQKRVTFGKNLYGMMNFNGDTILPFKFTEARVIPEGFCIASKQVEPNYNRLYGLYDLNGKQVLPHVFESIDRFYCGRAIVKKNGKYGLIDEAGNELMYTDYGRIARFANNYALVYTSSKNDQINVGIIDKNGREVVPAIYQWVDNLYGFREGLAAMAQNRKYGFVDTTGKVVIQFKYDKVESFDMGIAKVWVGWRYVGYINTKGEEIIPPDFEAMDQANLRRYFNKYIIGLKDSLYHVFDFSGKEIAILPYKVVGVFNETDKSFIVSKNNKWGTLDSNLRVQIPIEYESLNTIFPDYIAARKNNKIGFINHVGKAISAFEYDGIEPINDGYINAYENGVAEVVKNGKTGLINSYGKLIIPIKKKKK